MLREQKRCRSMRSTRKRTRRERETLPRDIPRGKAMGVASRKRAARGCRVITNGVSRLQTNDPIVLASLIVMGVHFLQAGCKRATQRRTEESMTTVDLITALFYEVDDQMGPIPNNPEPNTCPM